MRQEIYTRESRTRDIEKGDSEYFKREILLSVKNNLSTDNLERYKSLIINNYNNSPALFKVLSLQDKETTLNNSLIRIGLEFDKRDYDKELKKVMLPLELDLLKLEEFSLNFKVIDNKLQIGKYVKIGDTMGFDGSVIKIEDEGILIIRKIDLDKVDFFNITLNLLIESNKSGRVRRTRKLKENLLEEVNKIIKKGE